MANDLQPTDDGHGAVANPFGQDRSQAVAITASAAAMEQRAVAEVQASYIMAQKFPRDERASVDRIIDAFSRQKLAEAATYEYPRGGETITGPSIRAAEAIAQQWGNLDTGFSEIGRYRDDRAVGVSIVRVQAVDLQSRTRKYLDFHVRHWRDTKRGGYALTDERDIYELIANQSQRRLRACILALIPSDVVETAMLQAERTVKAGTVVNDSSRADLLAAFAAFGVTKEHIEKRIQRRFDTLTAGNMIGLRRIYTSLRDGISKPGDWFDALAEKPDVPDAVAALNAKVAPPPPPPATDVRPPAATQPPDDAPSVDHDALSRDIAAAAIVDRLDDLALRIPAVADAARREALTVQLRERYATLGGGA